MLSVKEAIEMRRSIRHFRPDDVPDELIRQMLEAARLAPSGSNSQPWRFLVIRDKEAKKELCRICLEQRFVEEAPVVIVCFSDLEAFSKEAREKRRQEYIDSGITATLSGRFANPGFRDRWRSLPATPPDQKLISYAKAHTFIAIEHLVLMATALGLGTCWVGGFINDDTAINRLFGLPDNLIPAAVIPVGYAAGEIPPQRPRRSLQEILLKPFAPKA